MSLPPLFFRAAMPATLKVLHCLEAERAHRLTLRALQSGLTPAYDPASSPGLAVTIAGLTFPNPLGLAAGFDKNAEAIAPLSRLGFGFIEIGSVTPRPQAGNARPRLFRLPEVEGVINRMGFNNDGIEAVAARLAQPRSGAAKLGLNLGANKDSEDFTADYLIGYARAAALVDYVTVNISSPNTPGLRMLQQADALRDLLTRLGEAKGKLPKPIFLKIAPDLSMDELDQIVQEVRRSGVIDALIVSNTTNDRQGTEHLPLAQETGGLSGKPLMAKSTEVLRAAALRMDGELPLIGVGGIASGADALAKLEAGASLVQLYSALVFQGPDLIRQILDDLSVHRATNGKPGLETVSVS